MDQKEFYDEWYRQILNDGQISIADILQYAPRGLQLYYKSDKFESIVYFECIEFVSPENKVRDVYIIVNTEPTDNNESYNDELTIIKTTTLKIKNTSITKTRLYPSEEYLSWKNWQYILFPKSVGAVISGLENKYFYIINDTEMVDEKYHFIYNMNIDSLPIFSYVDINKTKFKDIDCSKLIGKRTDAILFENNNIDKAIKSIKQENKIGNDAEFLNNTDEFVFIDSDWIEMIKDCKSKEDVIQVFSDKYGSDYVENIKNNILKFIPNYWESMIKYVNKNKGHECSNNKNL